VAGLAALQAQGPDALPLPLLSEVGFADQDDAVRRQAQSVLSQRMKEVTEADLPGVLALLKRNQQREAVRIGLMGVAHLGPKAKEALPLVLEAFTGEDPTLYEESEKAMRAIGPAARGTVATLLSRLGKAAPERKLPTALVLSSINPTDPAIVQAVTPILIRGLHPDHLGQQAPSEVLLQAIQAVGSPTVDEIFKALDGSIGQRGAAAANHRKYLCQALEKLGPAAFSEFSVGRLKALTNPAKEIYPDVRMAAGKAIRAMKP
jgi:hypothetical protein